MKINIKPLLLALLCLFTFSAFSTKAQTNDSKSKLIYMKVIESSSKSGSRIIISDGEKIANVIDLNSHLNKNYESNAITISKTLEGFFTKGYELLSAVSIGIGATDIHSTYLLRKEE